MQWPLLLDMTELECKSALRSMELVAYSEVVAVLRARGELTPEKRRLLSDLCAMWNISTDRHRAELRRVANDEKLNTIAETLFGAGTRNEWVMEGRRVVPVLPRARPITVYTAVADSSCKHEQQLCAALVPPSQTKTYRPVLESKAAVFSPVLRAAMSPVEPEQPADTPSLPTTAAPPVTSTAAPSIVTPLPDSRTAPQQQADAAVSDTIVRGTKRRHRSASDPGQHCTDVPPSSSQLQTTVGVGGDRAVTTAESTTQKGSASRPPVPSASISPAAAVSSPAATVATNYQRTVARGPPPSRHPLTAANNVAQTASTQKVIFVAAGRGGIGALSTPRTYQCAPISSDSVNSEHQRKARPLAQQPLVATPAVDPNTEAYRQLAGSGGLSGRVRMRGGRTAAGKRPVYSSVPVRGHQLRPSAVPAGVRLLAQPGRSAVGTVGRSLFVMPHSPAMLRNSGHAVGQMAVRQTVTARPRGVLSAAASRPSVIVLQRAAGGLSGRPALLRPVRPRLPRPHRLPTPQQPAAAAATSCASLADVLAVAGIVEPPPAAVSVDGAAGLSKTVSPSIALPAVVATCPVVRDSPRPDIATATHSRPAAARLTAAAVTSSAGRTTPLETADTFTLAEAMDLLESPDDLLLSRQSMGEQERHSSTLPISASSSAVGPAADSTELVGELDPRTGIFYPGAADDTAGPASGPTSSAAGHVEEADETLEQITAFLEDDVICTPSTTPGSGGV